MIHYTNPSLYFSNKCNLNNASRDVLMKMRSKKEKYFTFWYVHLRILVLCAELHKHPSLAWMSCYVWVFNDFLEVLFSQGGMIAQHTTLMTWCTSLNLFRFSLIPTGSKVYLQATATTQTPSGEKFYVRYEKYPIRIKPEASWWLPKVSGGRGEDI